MRGSGVQVTQAAPFLSRPNPRFGVGEVSTKHNIVARLPQNQDRWAYQMVKRLKLGTFPKISESAHWLCLISEHRYSLSHHLQCRYGLLDFSYRTTQYTPKSFNVDVLRAIADRHNPHPVQATRDYPLSLVAMLTTFDTD